MQLCKNRPPIAQSQIWRKKDLEPCDFYIRKKCDRINTLAVCYWEDDNVQFADMNYRGGANDESLAEARDNFKKFGVYSLQYLKNVRPPKPNEIP